MDDSRNLTLMSRYAHGKSLKRLVSSSRNRTEKSVAPPVDDRWAQNVAPLFSEVMTCFTGLIS